MLFQELNNYKRKNEGALVLGVVLLATVATLIIMPASASINGDADKLRDRDQTHFTHFTDCTFDYLPRPNTHTRTRLQIQDCKPAPMNQKLWTTSSLAQPFLFFQVLCM
jgi:hypothetical protein